MSIGKKIKALRTLCGLTQEELGDKVFVSKQAVSKWETGKTLPDIEMMRKLCAILQIDTDEKLGASIEETKKSRQWFKVLVVISVLCILVALFFGLGGVDYVDRHTQAGVAYVFVFVNGELAATDEYRMASDLAFKDYKNGYKAIITYGEIRGTIHLPNSYSIEFGFINTNNWHNVHIRLDVEIHDGQLSVKQTVGCETDNNTYQVMVTESTTAENQTSVFREGL